MCLAIYCEAGATCAESDLRTAFQANPDGAGFMYVNSGGALTLERFMQFDPFLAALDRATDQNPDSPFAIHFRWATHGSTTLQNVHPFRVDKHTALIHNGVLPVVMGKGHKRSDTAVFAEDYLPRLSPTWFDDPALFDMVEQYCAGSKLVVLTTHPAAKYGAYILNEKAGHWNEANDIWYSNGSYRAKEAACAVPAGYRTTSADVAWWRAALDGAPVAPEGSEICEWCGERDVMDSVCFTCELCQKCGDNVDKCDCYLDGYSLHTMSDEDIARLS